MISSTMLGIIPISANPAECPSEVCSSAQDRFHESLAQAASKQDPASSVSGGVPAPSEVERAVTQASPLGERVLQNLSAMHRGRLFSANALPSAAAGDPARPKSLEFGPAARPVLRSHEVEMHPVGKPEDVDHFQSTLANLKDAYNGVIQVSLVSKSAGAVSSSLNKLLSAG
ncbi:nodulation protein NolB [Bradyrhizobium sp. CIAT3101]|uniref:nodulation protein NolB n=1 Tax=Bradyrhizobium sp. CIAT3101 TaxID=439387 RepID=UPI0024B1AFF7|nr:nodulation protein NolB [Bradyrhizobium sp. CIAT3101]WFU80658.1 nodulation protein NolB [Bradyrhizobium sp. CIAT3101]